MRKGIMALANRDDDIASQERDVVLEQLRAENRQLKMQAAQPQKRVATEGFFDIFKSTPAVKAHAPVVPEKEKTMEERLDEAYEGLRDVSKMTDVGKKTVQGTSKTFLTVFGGFAQIKEHLSGLTALCDFVEKTCENSEKAHKAMYEAASQYAQTGDRLALFQAHKAYLKFTAPPSTLKGFKAEQGDLVTKTLFQGLVFQNTAWLNPKATWVITFTNVAHKPIADEPLSTVSDYDFPMLSYPLAVEHYAPEKRSADFILDITKQNLLELHRMLEDAFKKVKAILRKHDFAHSPIEGYIDKFVSELIPLGKKRDKNFNTNGYNRVEDNYYNGRYTYALYDLAILIDMHMDYFNDLAYLYEPDKS